MKKLIMIIAVVAGLISCSNNQNKSDAYGNFEATEVIVSSEFQGRITVLNLEQGQILKSGDVVGYIDSIQTDLRKEQIFAQKRAVATKYDNIQAQADVQKEQLKALKIEYNRIEKLLIENAATQRQFDDITGRINVVESQIKAIEVQMPSVAEELQTLDKQVAQVNDQLKKSIIINPTDGTVLQKYVEVNELATLGKPLYKIADLRIMELKVYVSGKQLPNIKLGQTVEVLVDKTEKENRKLSGTVSWISSSAEFTPKIIQTKEERVNLVYAVKIRVANDGSLKIGMPGEVNFR